MGEKGSLGEKVVVVDEVDAEPDVEDGSWVKRNK